MHYIDRSRRWLIRACGVWITFACGGALASEVTFTIDPTESKLPISRYIYGINPSGGGANTGLNRPAYSGLNFTLARLGGNRWTAYNWKTNASNAGNDYRFSNDNYLNRSTASGDAVKAVLTDAVSRGTAAIITVPINGYVSADESGPVPPHVLPENSPHFVPEYPSASDDPSPAPDHVYQDQFVAWVKEDFAQSLAAKSSHPIFFMLDNEPDLWSGTHPEVHPARPTYAEIVEKSIAYAKAIKCVAPETSVFGPASYGWNGFMTLQGAKDSSADNFSINPATGRRYGDFLSYYLAKMNLAGQTAGMRLLDALDVHWYPEATGLNASGVAMRITAADASPGVVAARMSAPRSLWDSSYVETSWITKNSTRGKAIALLPRLNSEIADNYPGTKLSISEYNFGGGSDISGGVAEADVLGLFGKYNVFAAAEWPSSKNERFILGAMRMFRNFDGKAGAFGDTSVRAVNSNPADTSIYASIDSIRPGRLVMVAINRTSAPITATITLQNTGITYASFTAYQLTSGCAATSDGACELPTLMGTFSTAALNSYTLPGQSVSTLVLNRTP